MRTIAFRGLLFVFLCSFFSCENKKSNLSNTRTSDIYITVLGTIQDAGFPHINNPKEWDALQKGEINKGLVVSLGLLDKTNNKKYVFDATPDMPLQLHMLESLHFKNNTIIDGVFLTHAHIGHYTGLMYFGREAMGAKEIPVYAMPKMKSFLETNGPWSQLVALKNIRLRELKEEQGIKLGANVEIKAFKVPHRDEFSETVGYKISGPSKTALFIPDINKWHLWDKDIIEEVKQVDYAIIDATFYANGEIPRDMSEVPHPFIEETITLFEKEPKTEKSKIIFIHFNHSNPVIAKKFKGRKKLEAEGYRFAEVGMNLEL